jgi:hypothetical protein
VNTTSTGLYYTYITNGTQYQVASIFESQKDKSQYGQSPMNPSYPEVNTKGSNLSLNPLWNPGGLVGYWPMDEGSGSTTVDASGSGNGGSLSSPAPTWTTGKVGNGALNFNGATIM